MPAVTAVQKNRRAKGARHAAGVQTAAERRRSELAEGIRAGAILRQREAALDLVTTAAALEAEGVTLADSAYLMPAPTADDPDATVDAREVIESAEQGARKRNRNVGRYRHADPRYMTGADVTAAATVAAGAAARQMSGAGMPRLEAEEWADLVSMLTVAALDRAAALRMPAASTYRRPAERARLTAKGASIALFHAPYGTPTADRRARLMALDAERHAAAPAWRTLTAEDGDYRGAWRAYLTATARTFARERITAHRAQVAAENAERDTGAERAAALAEGRAIAALLAERHALKRAEQDAAAAALAGETHRERAAREGVTPEAAKQRAKNGRRKLAERWPTAAALKRAVTDAERAAAEQEWERTPMAERAALLVDRHWRTVARLTGRPSERAATRLPRAGRRLLLMAPRATGKVPARMDRHARTGARWLQLMAAGLTVDPTDNRRPAPGTTRPPYVAPTGAAVLTAREVTERTERARAQGAARVANYCPWWTPAA